MNDPVIRHASLADRLPIARMCAQLWLDASLDEHLRDVDAILTTGRNGTLPMTIVVAQTAAGELAGFLEVGLRSHADGCDPAHPVGFVEGWFVQPAFRHRGIGRALMQAAEEWSRAQGCREMASDTWIDHEDSLRAHQALGFEIVDRCINFRKPL